MVLVASAEQRKLYIMFKLNLSLHRWDDKQETNMTEGQNKKKREGHRKASVSGSHVDVTFDRI